jgi:hypothetical protein
MIQTDSSQKTLSEEGDFSEQEFQGVVAEGLKRMSEPEFQAESWNWIRELDEDGIFIFSYLLLDYRNQTLTLKKFKETVYTLSMLMHKMLPPASKSGLSKIEEFQVIFTLYEKLKNREMSWEACEAFVSSLISDFQGSN